MVSLRHARLSVRARATATRMASTGAALRARRVHQRCAAAAVIDRVRVLGELGDELLKALHVPTDARRVKLSPSQRRHIVSRRREDARLCLRCLPLALRSLRYHVVRQRDPRVYELVAVGQGWQLLLALKLVRASRSKTGSDEWWLRTAFVLGSKRSSQLWKSGRLRILPTKSS